VIIRLHSSYPSGPGPSLGILLLLLDLYSPECVEGFFSAIRIQAPAWIGAWMPVGCGLRSRTSTGRSQDVVVRTKMRVPTYTGVSVCYRSSIPASAGVTDERISAFICGPKAKPPTRTRYLPALQALSTSAGQEVIPYPLIWSRFVVAGTCHGTSPRHSLDQAGIHGERSRKSVPALASPFTRIRYQ
jgi:hypothetical protein